MSQYLVLSHVKIQNANSIAGFTWGFPAITQFLGFTHALNRKFSTKYTGQYDSEFTGCMVIANQVSNKVYQPKEYADFEFLQSKTPPVLAKHKAGSPPIIEEGKVNLTVSLVLEFSNQLALTTEQSADVERELEAICRSMRVAGGTVLDIGKVKLLSASSDKQQADLLNKVKRLCMPGFVLQDRSIYLERHVAALTYQPECQQCDLLLKAWLDFSALKFTAQPVLTDEKTQPDAQTDAVWQYKAKPFSGYLVPLMTGFKAISEVYEAGQVDNVRDPDTPVCFVEAIHSVGEWFSLHRVTELTASIWRYHQQDEWYLCQQSESKQQTYHSAESDLTNTSPDIDEQLFNLF